MPGTLMVLNPKLGKKTMRRRKTRKMTAKQLKYFGTKAQRAKSSRRKASVVVVSANPKRGHMRKFRRNPKRHHRVHHRRFRRNPIGGTGFLAETLMPAAIGAAGAVAVDWLSNNLPLPQSMRTATMDPFTRIALALGVGWGVSAVAGSRAGAEAAAGGLIVALYNFAHQQLGGYGMGAGGYPFYGFGMNRYMHGMGFVRRNRPLAAARLQVINQRRANQGLGPVGPVGIHPQLAGGPYSQTKFRMMRNGATGGSVRGIGFIGPAPTVPMGRYVNGRNG